MHQLKGDKFFRYQYSRYQKLQAVLWLLKFETGTSLLSPSVFSADYLPFIDLQSMDDLDISFQ